MCSLSKIGRYFTFDRIVGYATIIGCVATIYGAKKIYSLTVELKPVIEIIQEEQSPNQKISPDTIVIMRRDTVIIKDTVSLPLEDYTMPSPEDKERKRINNDEERFRRRHQLP